jgi:hypothetical protein
MPGAMSARQDDSTNPENSYSLELCFDEELIDAS